MKPYYIILNSSDPGELASAVNEKMAEGYQPMGGVSVAVTATTYENHRKGYTEHDLEVTYAQAMVQQA